MAKEPVKSVAWLELVKRDKIMSKIIQIRKGEHIPFNFSRGGSSIDGWVCNIVVKKYPDATTAISRTITPTDGAWSGFLTSTEMDTLSTGLYRLVGHLTNATTDEEQQVAEGPVRFQVNRSWITDPIIPCTIQSNVTADLIDEDFTPDPFWLETEAGSSTYIVSNGVATSAVVSGQNAHAQSNNFGAQTEVWASAEITFTGNIATNSHDATFMSLLEAGVFNALEFQITNDSGALKFQTVGRNDITPVTTTHNTPVLVLGVNYLITLHYKKSTGSNDGIWEVWIEDTKILNIQNADNDTRDVDAINIGGNSLGSSVDMVAVIDNVKVGTTGSAPTCR